MFINVSNQNTTENTCNIINSQAQDTTALQATVF